MGLQQLKEEILDHANEEAKRIQDEAAKKAAEIIAENKQMLQKEEDEEIALIEKEMDNLEKKEMASATVETRKYIYDKKTELINEAFTKAEDEMVNMPKKEKATILTSLLKKAAKEMEIATVYCNPNDKDLIKGQFTVSVDAAIKAGIIVENKDKNIRIDYTVTNMLQQLKDKMLQEVASELFE